MSAPHHLVIVSAPGLFRDALAQTCGSTGWFRHVEGCNNGTIALEHSTAGTPTVTVIDSKLSRVSSLDLIRKLRRSSEAKVILLSDYWDSKFVMESLQSGAHGFVLKSSPWAELLEAMKRVLENSVFICPSIGVSLLSRDNGSANRLDTLSVREHETFQLLVQGVRAKEIANRFGLSPKTVDSYRSSLMRKLRIHSLAELVRFAYDCGLIGGLTAEPAAQASAK